MNLIDTNIILELLLNREKAPLVMNFLESVGYENIVITKFSLYSIGIILHKMKMSKVFKEFIEDFIKDTEIKVYEIEPDELPRVLEFAQKFNLDFDDAYQYAVAEKYDLKIISFDNDFDKTDKGRLTPEKALKSKEK
jgi:hypothetical protein